MSQKQLIMMIFFWALGLIISSLGARDFVTWALEIFPVVIGSLVLLYSNRKFSLPFYVMIWIFIHGLVLMIGGHYTYAEVPFGFWLKDIFHFERNPYDRIGHLFQGFVPALIAKEVLFRQVKIHSKKWIIFLSIAICLSVSVTYELVEWAAALILNQGAEAFLGTQGDAWDTQWDMFMALVGAILALSIYYQRWNLNPIKIVKN